MKALDVAKLHVRLLVDHLPVDPSAQDPVVVAGGVVSHVALDLIPAPDLERAARSDGPPGPEPVVTVGARHVGVIGVVTDPRSARVTPTLRLPEEHARAPSVGPVGGAASPPGGSVGRPETRELAAPAAFGRPGRPQPDRVAEVHLQRRSDAHVLEVVSEARPVVLTSGDRDAQVRGPTKGVVRLDARVARRLARTPGRVPIRGFESVDQQDVSPPLEPGLLRHGPGRHQKGESHRDTSRQTTHQHLQGLETNAGGR